MAAAPPNGSVEIVFCFDTTGSMCGYIEAVKSRIKELVERLLADIPNIRIGILAHGDYGDEPHMMQQLDFTDYGTQIQHFITNVRNTGGGDAAECYELALHEVRTSFSWTPGTRKRLVIIGDNEPHALGSDRNKRNIDWRNETNLLRDELHMVIYSVQAYPSERYEWFWKGLADMTGGKHLQLSNFASIFDFLMAICYLEHGVEFFEAFEHEVRTRGTGSPTGDVSSMLHRLGGADSAVPNAASDTDVEDEDEVVVKVNRRRKPATARLRGTRKVRSMKPKRTRRTVASSSRPKRESEPFSGKAIVIRGRWSPWHVLATPDAPKEASLWRPFGVGFLRNAINVPPATNGVRRRVLVELSVAQDDLDASVTPLYSRILRDGATNAVMSVLRGNTVLKWRLHRAITQGHHVMLRFAQIDSEGCSLRQQRHQLRKSNSYAWNSGRVVSGNGAKGLISVPAPRARLLSKFVRELAAERNPKV